MSWIDDWNNIIRTVIFPDQELRTLMNLPSDIKIIDFIDNYFIRAGYTGKLLTNQSVRIVYGSYPVGPTENPNVTVDMMSFDIYVKQEDLHNVSNDRLVFRNQKIAERLHYLLMRQKRLYSYKFWFQSEGDLGTSMMGYTRYNISFKYKRVYDI